METMRTAAKVAMDLFFYNRDNFRFDRKQRQVMEYELADMRVEQVALWRRDVRDFCTLTPRKMEIYLLVTALELGFCVMALCKARVPPGAPPWLVACHTLSVVGALMYLFLALWFGMHAFVSSQAYKVRILTQLVRLPIPTWQSLEAARTYASSYEKLSHKQMVRVPFVQGSQERRVADRPGEPGDRDAAAAAAGVPAEERVPSDPWGLERRGDRIHEVAPDVNTNVEKQRHIWLVREAAKFYQTYDAFCRISMSAGTSSLATFFCYYCMTYVLTENATPVGAFMGMIVFISCALWLLWSDLVLSRREYFIMITLISASPALGFLVTYASSKNEGHPGAFKFLIIIALLIHGFALFYYLLLFRVKEMQTGAVLPTAFRRVLFIDPFGWAKHTGTWWRQLRSHLMLQRRGSFTARLRSFSNTSAGSFPSDGGGGGGGFGEDAPQPTMQCVNAGLPRRPEDVEEPPTRAGSWMGSPTEEEPLNISFRPGTFARTEVDTTSEMFGGGGAAAHGEIQTGTDIHGEKPGLVPWRVFFVITVSLACCWWFAAGVSLFRTIHGQGIFHPYKTGTYGEIAPGEVMPIPEMFATKMETRWNTALLRPRGLACDPEGRLFVTAGHGDDGSHGLLHARISDITSDYPQSVHFGSVPDCSDAEMGHGQIQDVSLGGCGERGNCTALVLPKQGNRLISCPLAGGAASSSSPRTLLLEEEGRAPASLALGRSWLLDRGGEPLESAAYADGLIQPEELSSVSSIPCPDGAAATEQCVVLGTTARRVVQMGVVGQRASSKPMWVPKRLLRNDHGEVPLPGALTLYGGRYLTALYTNSRELRLMDLKRGGAFAGAWRLPPASDTAGGRWASICGAADALYALEDGESPSLWRFKLPNATAREHSLEI